MSSPRAQSGGKNSCRKNARYACNYVNIKSGKCPGYIVVATAHQGKPNQDGKYPKPTIRKRNLDVPKPPKPPVANNGALLATYYLQWKGKTHGKHGKGKETKGFWYRGDESMIGGKGQKLQTWNEQRCKPHTKRGAVHSQHKDADPNFLCQIYATRGREQKGCVATEEGDGYVGIYKKNKKGVDRIGSEYQKHQRTPRRAARAARRSPTQARPARAQGFRAELVKALRDQASLVPSKPRKSSKEKEEDDDQPAEKANYKEITEVRKAIDGFVKQLPTTNLFEDYFVPVKMKLPGREGPEVWVYQNKHYELREVTRNNKKMLGLFYVGTKKLPKGPMFLPYTGKIQETEPQNRDYVLTVGEGSEAPVIDSNPETVAKTTLKEPWVIGLSAFANEPGRNEEPNAYFRPWKEAGGKAGLLFATRTIKPGEEVLVCYGSGYEERDYPSSCNWTSSKDLGADGVLHFNDNAKNGVPVHWPVVEGKLEPFVTLVRNLCDRDIISEKHIKNGLTNKNAVIMAWIPKGGRSLRGIATIFPGEVRGSKEIQLLCTEAKYGRKMFEHYLKSAYYKKNTPLYLKAVPEAMKFWHKLGFRVVAECNKAEPEAIREMLHDNRIIDWTSTRQKGKGVKKIYQILKQHAHNDDLKPFLVNAAGTKREIDAVKMRWCHELRYDGTIAPEAKEPSLQRELSFGDTETKLSAEQLEDLHTRGYTLLKEGMTVNPDTTYYRQLEDFARNNAGAIFNPDDKRRQVELTGKKKKVEMYHDTERFTERVWAKLQKMFPAHTPNDLVVLSSELGCKEQKAHQDYLEKDLKKKGGSTPPRDKIPLGVIVALMDDTYIDVWPGAIKNLREASKVKPKRLRFDRGDIVIFRGDLVHAGSAYKKFNMRLHTYMDHPSVKRKFNSTQYVDAMECILDKEERPEIEEVSRGGGIRSDLKQRYKKL